MFTSIIKTDLCVFSTVSGTQIWTKQVFSIVIFITASNLVISHYVPHLYVNNLKWTKLLPSVQADSSALTSLSCQPFMCLDLIMSSPLRDVSWHPNWRRALSLKALSPPQLLETLLHPCFLSSEHLSQPAFCYLLICVFVLRPSRSPARRKRTVSVFNIVSSSNKGPSIYSNQCSINTCWINGREHE